MKTLFTKNIIYFALFIMVFCLNYSVSAQGNIRITVSNSFNGGDVRIAAITYPSGTQVTLINNDFYTISAINRQNYGGYVRIFKYWNNNSDDISVSKTLLFREGTYEYIAHFVKEFNFVFKNCNMNGDPIGGIMRVSTWDLNTPYTLSIEEGYYFSMEASQTDIIYNGMSYTFDHWEDGSTTRKRDVKPKDHTTFIAYYKGTPLTKIEPVKNIPVQFDISCFPNPFNPSTTFSIQIPNSEQVRLKVFDRIGREIATLVDGFLSQGTHRIKFNGENLTSGIYMYQMTAGKFNKIGKIMLMK